MGLSTLGTSKIKVAVGWVERSETQQDKGFRWVTLTLIHPTQLKFPEY